MIKQAIVMQAIAPKALATQAFATQALATQALATQALAIRILANACAHPRTGLADFGCLIRHVSYKTTMTGSRQIGIDVAVHRAIEQARLALGESENDILRRLLLPRRGRPPRARSAAGEAGARAAGGPPRSRGLWSVEIGGRRIAAANLKHAYRLLLRELDAAHPHFLAAFAEEKTHGRRFVARTPAALYGRSPHLARRHAEPLVEGWYFDSNLSTAQVAKRARIAARLCGLCYGSDARILDNMREI